jgi:hypothetical protein
MPATLNSQPQPTVWGYTLHHRILAITYDRCLACYERYYRDSTTDAVVEVRYVGDPQLMGKQDCVYCGNRRMAESRRARLESHDHA